MLFFNYVQHKHKKILLKISKLRITCRRNSQNSGSFLSHKKICNGNKKNNHTVLHQRIIVLCMAFTQFSCQVGRHCVYPHTPPRAPPHPPLPCKWNGPRSRTTVIYLWLASFIPLWQAGSNFQRNLLTST